MTVGSGFTILNIRAHSGSCSSGVACPATAFLGLEYQIVSSTTGIAATWTFSPSLEYAAIVTTYKQAASAAACTLTLIGVGRGC